MIYKYPEEFVVPVVYASDLSNKPMYRDWGLDFEVEEVIIPDKKQEDKGLAKDSCKCGMFDKKVSKDKIFDMNLLKEPYQKDMLSHDIVNYDGKSDQLKAILNEIDNDYAESEVLKV